MFKREAFCAIEDCDKGFSDGWVVRRGSMIDLHLVTICALSSHREKDPYPLEKSGEDNWE